MKTMRDLKKRILDISKELGLSHIGSNLSALPILEEIYHKRGLEDSVVLDNAHAHLAHLMFTCDPELQKDLIKIYGIHCDRKAYCDASGGSLAHTGIALGIAIANRKRKCYLIVSDGSVNEGSFAESLRIAHQLKITNLEIHANFNGYSAVEKIDLNYYEQWIKGFGFPVIFHRTNNGLSELAGVQGHYKKL